MKQASSISSREKTKKICNPDVGLSPTITTETHLENLEYLIGLISISKCTYNLIIQASKHLEKLTETIEKTYYALCATLSDDDGDMHKEAVEILDNMSGRGDKKYE